MLNPLPELSDLPQDDLHARNIAAIEAHIAKHGFGSSPSDLKHPDLEPGEPVQEAASQPLPVEETKTIPEPTLPKKVHLGHGSPFAPPGFIFTGVGKNLAQKNYERWVNKRLGDALSVSGKEGASQVSSTYAAAMRFLRTAILIAKAKVVHGEVEVRYTGPKLPRPLDIVPAILKMVEANQTILLAMAPYFGLGATPQSTTPAASDQALVEEITKLPEPEILDAAPSISSFA